jgi:hypothetical protein
LEDGAKAPYGPIYYLFKLELRILRDYLAKNEQRKWIRRSKFLIKALILFMPKSNRGLRFYVDYRALNKFTVKNRHALLLINETINRLSDTKIYTKLNLKDAYHRIRMKANNEWKTAFRTRYGHFEYIIIFFGLTNIPATFQIYVNEILTGLLNIICVIFLNDIYIYSDSIEEYEEHVR